MANGSLALHDHVASRLDRALGKSPPQVEVRFENVSISAQVVVQTESNQVGLPTLSNVAKTGLLQLFTSTNRVEKQILHPVSGVLKPSTLTLVLGQPGSGKSSLMKILSGRFPVSKNVTVEGEVTYNGTSQEELRSKLPQFVSYVPQHDRHLARLSVKETLEFAHACKGQELSKPEENQLVFGSEEDNKVALEAARAFRTHYPDVVVRQLGLDNCQNTIVGNEMLRGISGGERKRVTTGEMAFGNNHVMLMDEISTGLDSAATLDIVTTLRSLAKQFRRTVVVSLLQPSPEVFALFDDVMLLNEGYMMYHGPRDQALTYFESLGFQCPPRRDVADFLLDLGTNKQLQYQVGSTPSTPDQFREAFQQSSIYQHQENDLRSPVLPQEAVHFAEIPEFYQSFGDGAWTLVKREMTLLLRDTNAFKGRLLMAILLGLLQGSTFYQFDDVNSQVAMGIAFVTTNFVATNHVALDRKSVV